MNNELFVKTWSCTFWNEYVQSVNHFDQILCYLDSMHSLKSRTFGQTKTKNIGEIIFIIPSKTLQMFSIIFIISKQKINVSKSKKISILFHVYVMKYKFLQTLLTTPFLEKKNSKFTNKIFELMLIQIPVSS